MPLAIIAGSIVTIQLEEYDGSLFGGKQGEVVSIGDNGSIGIKFPDWYEITDPDFFHFLQEKKATTALYANGIFYFQKDELLVNSAWRQPEISDKHLCNALFGQNMWHARQILTEPFIPNFFDCMIQDCEEKALLRIMVNAWGTVFDVDVCAKHASFHGRNCDSFPGFPGKRATEKQITDVSERETLNT